MFASKRLRTAGAVLAVSAVLVGAGCSSEEDATSTGTAAAGAYTSAETALDKVRAAFEITAGQEVQRGEIAAQGDHHHHDHRYRTRHHSRAGTEFAPPRADSGAVRRR